MNENQMNRVIQALECCKSEEGLCAGCPYFKYINSNTGITCQEQLANDALELIRQLKDELNQFVNADKKVECGEWGKEAWTDTEQHICSLCHSTVRVSSQSVIYKYCPYCGAKMKGGDKNA